MFSFTIDEIYLQSPADATGERTVAARWRGVRTRLGLAQIQHRLDEQAASGTWTVTARLNDGTTMQHRLDEQAASGTWTVTARLNDGTTVSDAIGARYAAGLIRPCAAASLLYY
ncbi:unnamed protein product [Plutella xylostella]|uniref:(diamondback moth) hypothetical protein n=1 Tax=Plutella xylostella TaxID=51655 RepID=A0A8S4FJJ4_PLUXY|nr:unnamed protein product [Plutella xylostella]